MSGQSKEYADIMGRETSFGTFLFIPQWFSTLRLGSVGYFDRTGEWNEITNLLEKGQAEKDGFKPFSHDLKLRDVRETHWQAGSAETETGRSSRLTTEASGAIAAAPVEASVQVKTNSSTTGSAALITSSVVRNYRFQGDFKGPVKDWVENNAKALVERRSDIETQGLWAVMGAWVTDECAIKMTSGKNQEIDVSFDLGATGIGKLGAGAGAFDKLKREGWWTYPKNEKSQGYVVSFAGVEYSLRSFHKLRSTPLKVYNETISLPPKQNQPGSAEKEHRMALLLKLAQLQQIENKEEKEAELKRLAEEYPEIHDLRSKSQ
ncbi:uncharacterized protein AKAW2_71076S [Aspergillus luchuensis]|uniref:Uncharacterized protein n=1 Tax=Aspergillus kawachii TaxID=1069201 RepID=A0A7R7WJK4_ASPKA|nr:uncharacterized protein AKAW2_71076S [Aspergillus luchuensis]BCS04198.1 hypothetical protein AKAW2_71076S [Aspergillus luchuensis]BCS15792.1 hypothetical protein ALUC_71025S [Aspergillus luchuensis]GAA91466.1 hypothetical protein AKAW_09580 [Aspergillus luchuensis IFO 4308]